MPHPLKMVIFLLFFLSFLTLASGCTSTILEPVLDTKLVSPKVPKQVRTCADKVRSKITKNSSQKDVAILIAQIDFAHDNCKSNLAVVDKILTRNERKISEFNNKKNKK